jgi:hypothetical protein
MPSNDVILLADMLERDKALYDNLDKHHDTYFTAQHYLRAFNPTHDDLVSGLVDGERDGGIDAMYIFANSACIRDDTTESLGRGAEFELHILQVKNSKSFGEDAINRLLASLPKLLDFSRDENALSRTYNPRLLELTRRFLQAYRASHMPKLRVSIVFASLQAEHVHPNLLVRAEDLTTVVHSCFGGAHADVAFLKAADVADMARDQPATTRQLVLAEIPIATTKTGGYVAVVRLSEYSAFITDDAGRLDASLFEANVRDYEGDVSVNQSIQDTLTREQDDVDFWWLNNGVTIVARKVQPAGKLLQLDAPQVVNGLQTSNEIHKRRQTSAGLRAEMEVRCILVKVIQAEDDAVRDRIIRATNSQTALGPSALRATDKVQRQIEEFLSGRGLFYERRRRHYFNQGKTVDALVSIDQMGQALLSVFVQYPHIARGESSRVYETDLYDLLFAPNHPIQLYAVCIELVRQTQRLLNGARHTRAQSEDFVFHVAMLTAIAMTRKQQPRAADLVRLLDQPIDPDIHQHMLRAVQREYARVGRFTGEVMLDRMAKDPEITKTLLAFSRSYLAGSAR